ncbi:hypothetical protein GFY24_08165 [Nocardia sp. SYP-A9097]|uniref:hypothetical protein n=1 Tax=Nocardia sp. SYP-A9097 TaxID=2663237 RepID=UPI00129B5527|nr:hypothetical protein [Nocardia sp. SYP-A9097]MRH87433.1 hypothetical protein [Nocardia sp. SYP-A9097]
MTIKGSFTVIAASVLILGFAGCGVASAGVDPPVAGTMAKGFGSEMSVGSVELAGSCISPLGEQGVMVGVTPGWGTDVGVLRVMPTGGHPNPRAHAPAYADIGTQLAGRLVSEQRTTNGAVLVPRKGMQPRSAALPR